MSGRSLHDLTVKGKAVVVNRAVARGVAYLVGQERASSFGEITRLSGGDARFGELIGAIAATIRAVDRWCSGPLTEGPGRFARQLTTALSSAMPSDADLYNPADARFVFLRMAADDLLAAIQSSDVNTGRYLAGLMHAGDAWGKERANEAAAMIDADIENAPVVGLVVQKKGLFRNQTQAQPGFDVQERAFGPLWR